MRVLIKTNDKWAVAHLLVQDDDGFITHSRALELSEPGTTSAEMAANAAGFGLDGDWFDGGESESHLCYLAALPFTISFVSTGDISDAEAQELAESAGYKVGAVISKQIVPEQSVARYTFAIDLPMQFDLSEYKALEPFND